MFFKIKCWLQFVISLSKVGINSDNTQIFFAKEDSIDESVRLQLIGFDVASGEAFATVGAQDVDGNARLDASVL